MRPEYYNIYKSYEHYEIGKAESDYENTQGDMYEVITINWTSAEGDCTQVHRNVYHWRLDELTDFIRTLSIDCPECGYSAGIGENIISIKPMEG